MSRQYIYSTLFVNACRWGILPHYPITMADKEKYELEFEIQSSPTLLYQYISTPSGMSEWFADNVNSRGKFFRFIWDGSEEKARIVMRKNGERVRFQWEEDEEEGNDYYFEMKIVIDGITKDVSLIVTDFAEDDEIEESKMFWENQISELKLVLGSA